MKLKIKTVLHEDRSVASLRFSHAATIKLTVFCQISPAACSSFLV